jgi:hypothetical protein
MVGVVDDAPIIKSGDDRCPSHLTSPVKSRNYKIFDPEGKTLRFPTYRDYGF